MTITLRDIIAMPDLHVEDGLGRVACALIADRDGAVDLNEHEFSYDLESDQAKAFASRITTHVKIEEIVDYGDGREGLDVVCLDGKPVAAVTESGYDYYTYEVAVADLAALDAMVAAARALRKSRLREMTETGLDEDVAQILKLEPSGPPTPC